MNIMPGLESTASALAAEKVRLDVIGQNIANAHTTKGPDGKPYSRQMVSFETKLTKVCFNKGLPTIHVKISDPH